MRRKRAPGEILEPFFIALVVTSGAVIEDSFVEETCSIKVAKLLGAVLLLRLQRKRRKKTLLGASSLSCSEMRQRGAKAVALFLTFEERLGLLLALD